MIRAVGLIEIMILNRLEVQCSRIVKRVIGYRTAFGRGGSPDVPALKVRNLCESTNFGVKQWLARPR